MMCIICDLITYLFFHGFLECNTQKPFATHCHVTKKYDTLYTINLVFTDISNRNEMKKDYKEGRLAWIIWCE